MTGEPPSRLVLQAQAVVAELGTPATRKLGNGNGVPEMFSISEHLKEVGT